MDSVPINFCGKKGFNIRSNETKQTILDDLHSRFGVAPLSRRTDVLCDRNKTRLSQLPTVVHLQTTGTSYVMYLTRVQGQKTVLLIDRKIKGDFAFPKIIMIHMFFPSDFFDGTVLTGELISGISEWMFLIDDVVAIKGTNICSHMFRERYSAGLNMIRTHHIKFETDMFSMCMKRFYQINRLGDAIRDARYLPYKVKGISIRSTGPFKRDIFVPMKIEHVQTRYMYISSGAKDDMFYASESDDMYSSDKTQLHVPDIEISHALKARFGGVPYGCKIGMPCEWNSNFEKWQPVLDKF